MSKTNCALCGKAFPIHPPGYCGGAGYAKTADGKLICYACADAQQIDDMRDRSSGFCAYLSSDCKTVTTWTGGKLGDVVSSQDGGQWASIKSVRVKDVHGAMWRAPRGQAGMIIHLQPTH